MPAVVGVCLCGVLGVVQQPPSRLWVCSPSVTSPTSGVAPRAKLWRPALGQRKGHPCSRILLFPCPCCSQIPAGLQPPPWRAAQPDLEHEAQNCSDLFLRLFLPPLPQPGAHLSAGAQEMGPGGEGWGCWGRSPGVAGWDVPGLFLTSCTGSVSCIVVSELPK